MTKKEEDVKKVTKEVRRGRLQKVPKKGEVVKGD